MALPSGISTCTVTVGSAVDFFGGNATISVQVRPVLGGNAKRITWAATGQPLTSFSGIFTGEAGAPATFTLPHVDQTGFKDGAGNAFSGWSYLATVTITNPNTGETVTYDQAFQIFAGQTTVDLDLVPDGTIGSPTSAPSAAVTSVNGQTGAAVVGLGDVAATATTAGALVVGKTNPVDATAGPLTMTLAAAPGAGRDVVVSKVDASTNAVTISVANLRGNAGTLTLVGQYETLHLSSKADGSWWVVGDHRTKAWEVKTYARSLLFTDPAIGGVGDGTTDNTAAWNRAMALIASSGGEVVFPAQNGGLAVYRIDGTTDVVPGGTVIRGTGYDYHTPSGSSDRPRKGAVVRAGAAMSRLIQLGSDATVSTSGQTGASVADLVIDGNGAAQAVVRTAGRRNRVDRSYIIGGLAQGVLINGQNSWVNESKISGENVGDCIFVTGFNDHKIFDNEIRQNGSSGNGGIRLLNASKIMIRGNHFWTGQNGVSLAGSLIYIEANAGIVDGIQIVDNTIEGSLSSKVYILASQASATIRNINIVGNDFYQPDSITDNTLSLVKLDGTGTINAVNVADNPVLGFSATNRFKAVVESTGGGTRNKIRVAGNVGSHIAAAWVGLTPEAGGGNLFYNGTASVATSATGRATLNGTGAATTFTIAHGLSAAPRSVRVTPGSAAAAASFYATADATNITVTYSSAPASGTGNVILNWEAEV